jgi:CelD/BcsL family acetyltransferase involved in cellulose biosynthesis
MSLTITESQPYVAAPSYTARLLDGFDDPRLTAAGDWAVTAFETPGFLRALAETIGAAQGARPLLVAAADASGRDVALFPFIYSRQGGLGLIEGMGLGVSDYYAPLTAPGFSPDARETARLWRAVVAALPRADVLRLRNVPPPGYGARHALSEAGFLAPMGHAATVLRLRDAEGEAVDPEAMSVARDVRRKARKLSALGELRLDIPQTPADVDRLMDALVAFRLERFAELGRGDILARPDVEAFYRRLADPRGGRPVARLFGLSVGGETVAVVYGLEHKGVFTLIIPAMSSEERWQAGSPGLVALHMSLSRWLELGGRVYDFSVGALHYKTRFGADKVELMEHQQALSPRGWPPVVMGRARTALRVFLQRHERFSTVVRGAIRRLRPRADA